MSAVEGMLLAWQIAHNLQQLRSDMVDNARVHTDRLNAGQPVADVRTDMVACFQAYSRRVGWVEDVVSAPARKEKIATGFAPWPGAAAEVEQRATAARAIITNISGMPRNTRAELLAICDVVRGAVTRADMLWID